MSGEERERERKLFDLVGKLEALFRSRVPNANESTTFPCRGSTNCEFVRLSNGLEIRTGLTFTSNYECKLLKTLKIYFTQFLVAAPSPDAPVV